MRKDSFHFPYTESELLAGLTPEKAHADELAKLMVSESGDYMEPVQYIDARREIVWLNFEPTRGKEIG